MHVEGRQTHLIIDGQAGHGGGSFVTDSDGQEAKNVCNLERKQPIIAFHSCEKELEQFWAHAKGSTKIKKDLACIR